MTNQRQRDRGRRGMGQLRRAIVAGGLSAGLVLQAPVIATAATVHISTSAFDSDAATACGVSTIDFEDPALHSDELLVGQCHDDFLVTFSASAGFVVSPEVDSIVHLVRDGRAGLVQFDYTFDETMDIDGPLGDEDLPLMYLYLAFDDPIEYLEGWFISVSQDLQLVARGPGVPDETVQLPVTGVMVPGGIYAGVVFDNPVTEIEITGTLGGDEWAIDDLGLPPLECHDQDGDGYRPVDGDCDDLDPLSYPGADELCDGIDNDCDGAPDPSEVDENYDLFLDCVDTDGDGVTYADGDCAPWDPTVYPGAEELCDGIDNDCDDTLETWDVDGDYDGYLDCVDTDLDGFTTADGDCDPWDPTVYPGAVELCDGIDNDCDDVVEWWDMDANSDLFLDCVDTDGDGIPYADGDCDPWDPTVYPGAEELCDGIDNDCDGAIEPWDVDGDYDDYLDCVDTDGDGVTTYEGDCDPWDDSVYPGALEVCDGLDNDCDGEVPRDEQDFDHDTYAYCEGDIDDFDSEKHPYHEPELTNGVDSDYDGETAGRIWGCQLATPAGGSVAASWAALALGLALLAIRRRRPLTATVRALRTGRGRWFGALLLVVAAGWVGCAGGPDTEAACGDGIDNDGDGQTDCDDLDCGDSGACDEPAVEVCGDGLDNDRNGLVDCQDPACDPDCNPDAEIDCDDQLDNDLDGDIDCLDDDCEHDPICIPDIEDDCGNGIDDDLDGLRDCQDDDCFGHEACPEQTEYACDNELDDDLDGLTDCDDPDCTTHPACVPGFEEDCGDGADDDLDGWIDCEDTDCEGDDACLAGEESDCGNGLDDDLDGDEDCADLDCALAPECAPDEETDCVDGVDDDLDGLVDCDDSDCATNPTCWAPSEGVCDDGLDDDGDGLTDCEDGDCVTAPECAPEPTEVSCADLTDNDVDGLTDCEDPDCLLDPVCGTALDEFLCDDLFDNDLDGLLDCDDDDCAWNSACAPGCPSGDLGSATGVAVASGTTLGAGADHPSNLCGAPTGEDVALTWTAPYSGPFTVRTEGSDFNTVLSLLDGTCNGVEIACNDNAVDLWSSITFDAAAGDTFVFVVAGFGIASGTVVLSVDVALPDDEAGFCADGTDDDGDGLTDCDDPDCAAECWAPEDCAGGGDEDLDGMADCADPDCTGELECSDDCPLIDLGQATGADVAVGTTVGLFDDHAGSSCGTTPAADVAFEFTAPADGTYVFSTAGATDFDTVLTLRETDCQGPELACNDDAILGTSEVILGLAAGQQVVVIVDGFGFEEGDYALSITAIEPLDESGICADGVDNDGDGWTDCGDLDCEADPACDPVEHCANGLDDDGDGWTDCDDEDCTWLPVCNLLEVCPRFDLGSQAGFGILEGDNQGTGDQLDLATCGSSDGDDFSFGWTAPAGGTFTFDTLGSGYDTVLYLLQDDCDGPVLECNDDAEGIPQSSLTADLLAGQQVVIAIDAPDGENGAFVLNIHDPTGATEFGLCDDGEDDDGDGATDCADPDCTGATPCTCCQSTPGVPGCGLNPAVESCVCTHMPSCCNGEWDAACAGAVEDLGCGSCS